jgi:hypothetical protein
MRLAITPQGLQDAALALLELLPLVLLYSQRLQLFVIYVPSNWAVRTAFFLYLALRRKVTEEANDGVVKARSLFGLHCEA